MGYTSRPFTRVNFFILNKEKFMNQNQTPFSYGAEATSRPDRSQFVLKLFNTLAGAVLLFACLEFFFLQSGIAQILAGYLIGSPWLVLFAIMGGGWIASSVTSQSDNVPLQYLALGAFVVLYAVIFAPMLLIAEAKSPGAIENAAVATLALSGGLMYIGRTSKTDFSFLGNFLKIAGFASLGLVICALIFGFSLGLWFSYAMVLLAGGFILYEMSDIVQNYPDDRYVAGALQLFASIAMMFSHLLRIFSSRD
jgi:FtsH-binding integral membrane protein